MIKYSIVTSIACINFINHIQFCIGSDRLASPFEIETELLKLPMKVKFHFSSDEIQTIGWVFDFESEDDYTLFKLRFL